VRSPWTNVAQIRAVGLVAGDPVGRCADLLTGSEPANSKRPLQLGLLEKIGIDGITDASP
jgi:hypothetical protein